jgi:hypothetical protein
MPVESRSIHQVALSQAAQQQEPDRDSGEARQPQAPADRAFHARRGHHLWRRRFPGRWPASFCRQRRITRSTAGSRSARAGTAAWARSPRARISSCSELPLCAGWPVNTRTRSARASRGRSGPSSRRAPAARAPCRPACRRSRLGPGAVRQPRGAQAGGGRRLEGFAAGRAARARLGIRRGAGGAAPHASAIATNPSCEISMDHLAERTPRSLPWIDPLGPGPARCAPRA